MRWMVKGAWMLSMMLWRFKGLIGDRVKDNVMVDILTSSRSAVAI